MILSNQIFYCSLCITPKYITSSWVYICITEPAGNTAPFRRNLQRWQGIGNAVSDLTSRNLYHQSLAPETNVLPLDQLAGRNFIVPFFCLYTVRVHTIFKLRKKNKMFNFVRKTDSYKLQQNSLRNSIFHFYMRLNLASWDDTLTWKYCAPNQ